MAGLLSSIGVFGQCGQTGDTLFVYADEDWAQLLECDSVYGSLEISHWDISNLDNLLDLVWIEEHLILDENISLLNDDGLSGIQHIGGDLVYANNFTLQEINSLAGLQSLGGSLVFDGNITLISIDGFENLSTIQGDLIFRENHTLEACNGLQNLTAVEGDLEFESQNLVLNNFDGLDALQSVGGDVSISLPLLLAVDGLNAIQTIGGSLTVNDMTLCANIEGLGALESVGEDLLINDNTGMVHVNGLTSLLFVGGDVDVSDNPSLFLCCGLQPLLSDGTVDGITLVEENGFNCDSPEEILEECAESVVEQENPIQFHLQGHNVVVTGFGEIHTRLIDPSGRLLGEAHGDQRVIMDLPNAKGAFVVVAKQSDGRSGSEVILR